MPNFPKPLPAPPRFAHPPLADLRAVVLEFEVDYETWQGAFFPQLQDNLADLVRPLLLAAGLDVTTTPACPLLHFEITVKSLHGTQGVGGGFVVKVEAYLQEEGRLTRVVCPLPVITWSYVLHTWLVFGPMPLAEIVLAIEGEVERQARAFVADWQRDNPGIAPCPPLPACPPPPHAPPAAACGLTQLAGQWGVNLAHLEYCSASKGFSNLNPGAYLNARASLFGQLAHKGAKLFRIPLRWERLEPVFGQLNLAYLDMIRGMIHAIRNVGGLAILDLHNSFRYWLEEPGEEPNCWFVGQIGPKGNAPVALSHLTNLWKQLSEKFKHDPTVIAYGIMNQPFPPTPADAHYQWFQASQAVVKAIRDNDDQTQILVDGDNFAYTDDWPQWNPRHWIDDPGTVYEAHVEIKGTSPPARALLRPFVDWCAKFKVPGFLGSVRLDTTHSRCREQVADFRAAAAAAQLGWCYWPASNDLELTDPNSLVWQHP